MIDTLPLRHCNGRHMRQDGLEEMQSACCRAVLGKEM
jgi:hypothetical protein